MSETIEIHFHGTQGCSEPGRSTGNPNIVTCPECLRRMNDALEQPMQSVPGRVEYKIPAQVDAMDRFLAAKAQHAARRLHAVRASEEFALKTAEYWAKTWREAVSLRVRLEAEALVPEAGVSEDLGAETLSTARNANGYAVSRGQEILAEKLSNLAEKLSNLRVSHLNAPVNAVDIRPCCDAEPGQPHTGECTADLSSGICPSCGLRDCDSDAYRRRAVDIRTGVRDDEGMTSTDSLSAQAKSALINAQPHQGAEVPADALWLRCELTDAGLMGPQGGLTRLGTIARAKLVQAAEDAAFG